MKKNGTKIYTLKIYCAKCKALLYKYQKEGAGKLIKCYKDRIVKDYTKAEFICPGCEQVFARDAVYHNRPANKIIQGKVFVRK